MSNAIFPTLAGQAWPRHVTPMYKTDVQTSDSGRSWHVPRALYPTYKFKISYDYLSATDRRSLQAFFEQHKGRGESFLFDDRDDRLQNDSASAQLFGTGDGTRVRWQLVRNAGGIVAPIGRHNTMTSVRVAGLATTAYTLDDYGFLTFNTAPAAAAALDWQGSFYWRCVFANDSLAFEEFLRHFWSNKSVEFQTWKA